MNNTPAKPGRKPEVAPPPVRARLADVPSGSVMRVVEIDASVARWREQLQAYGLAPGREVEVIQHEPVTVVRVEYIDLAFESKIARGIMVDIGGGGTGRSDAPGANPASDYASQRSTAPTPCPSGRRSP